MDSGYIELTQLNQQLSSFYDVSFRMALVRVEEDWHLHTLILESLPKEGNQDVSTFNMDYGAVCFAGGLVRGDTAVRWLYQRAGDVKPVGKSGPVRHFSLPPFNGKVSWQKFPSHASYDFVRMPWPITRYDATGGSASALLQHSEFLLADGLQFYPDLKTAILQLIYQVTDVRQFENSSVSPAVIVRVADTGAWLNEIKISPTSIHVKVSGTRVPGAQLTIRGSSDTQFQQQLHVRGSVECPLPNGVPSPLWIVLSRNNQWLDYYHRDERWPVTYSHQSNVTIEGGDRGTELAAIIAQGEGLTTEFKQDVPKEREQMLKTIAAFANGAGGVVLLGVKDKTGELVGFAGNPDDITQMIRNTVFPEPLVEFEVAEVEKRTILAIYVHKGAAPPYGLQATSTRYYVRRGATTFPARPEELRAIVLASQSTASGPFADYLL